MTSRKKVRSVKAWALLSNGVINPCDIFRGAPEWEPPIPNGIGNRWVAVEIRPLQKKVRRK